MDWLCGIDTVAHANSINYSGKTIAVLGTGFNNIFPEKNIELFNNIATSGGLVITEYEPDVSYTPSNFPKRNRIITALSIGTLVVEAAQKSGASLTASIAKSQGKPVFCIPANIDSKHTRTNEIIQNGGILVNSIETILKTCKINYDITSLKNVKQNSLLNKIPDTTTKTNKPCPKEYEEIYKLLSSVPKHINNIIKASNQNSSKVSSILTMLEIEGLVESLPGGFFKLI